MNAQLWILRRVSEGGEIVEEEVNLADYVTIITLDHWYPSADGEVPEGHGNYSNFDEEGRSAIVSQTREGIFYVPLEDSRPDFDYYRSDPAQWGHGDDGGTPMTLEELLSADEKMDRIDQLLDGGMT